METKYGTVSNSGDGSTAEVQEDTMNLEEWRLPEEEGRQSTVERVNKEWYHTFASRVMYTKGYLGFYFFMLLLSGLVLIWSLVDFIEVSNRSSDSRHGESRHPVLLALDAVLVISLTIEVTIRYIATADTFFDKCSNYWDCVLTILCLSSLILGFILPKSSDSDGVTFFMFLETILLCVRSFLVFGRVTKIMLDRRKAQRLAFSYENEVVFNENTSRNLAVDGDEYSEL